MIDPELYDLMDRFGRSKLSHLKLTTEHYTIELDQTVASDSAAAAPSHAAAPAPSPSAVPEETAVKAPLVGTFYARPAPDQEPFVKVGDTVAQGQTLCLLEAMKMMSEIPAPCDLVVESVLKSDGELCSFGEPLVRYRAV